MAKTDKMDAVLAEARKRYQLAYSHEEQNLEKAMEDLEFIASDDQWPTDAVKARGENRLRLTINQLPQYIRQIVGDLRLNKPSIKARPVSGGASEDMAEVITGHIRSIEHESKAQTHYVQAVQDAARSGWGVLRLLTKYATEETFDLDIVIGSVSNPLAVIFDPDSRDPVRRDAMFCFVVQQYTWDRFKEMYPDAAVSGWDQFRSLDLGEYINLWRTEREIAVAEYWCKKPVTRTLIELSDGAVFLAEAPPVSYKDIPTDELIASAVRKRKVETYKVESYLMTGAEILEGPTEWAGMHIPIIPVVGEEICVGDRVVRHGAIRYAKDVQRAYNYHITTAVEAHALAPRAPWLGTVEQFQGLEDEWGESNAKNKPFLRYNPDPEAPPPSRVSVSTDIGSSMALATQAKDDLSSTIGIYPAALGARSNETSGRAILARQREADVGTFLYQDNLARSIEYLGEQIIDLIPHIYDTERTIRTMEADGKSDSVTVNMQEQQVAEDGRAAMRVLNDITIGRYDVIVDVGPAFSTRRQEAAQAMSEFASLNPQMAQLVMDLLVDNMDWPGADRMAERFRRALPPGVDPEVDAGRQQEAANQPPQSPDPVQEMQFAAMQEDLRGKQIDNAAKEAKVQMDAHRLQVDTEKAVAEAQGKDLENAQRALELSLQTGEFAGMVRALIAQELQQALQGDQGLY